MLTAHMLSSWKPTQVDEWSLQRDDPSLRVSFFQPLDVRNTSKGTSVIITAIHLIATFAGAGLVTLPHAFAALGTYAGLCLITFVTIVMYIAMHAVVKSTNVSGHASFGRIITEEFGHLIGSLAQICIILSQSGVLILYLTVLGDILIGTSKDSFDGLLPNLIGDHSGDQWYLSRWFVILVLCLLCIQPLVLQRRLGSLVYASIAIVALISVLALFLVFLAVLTTVDSGHSLASSKFPIAEKSIGSSDDNCAVSLVIKCIAIYIFAYLGHCNIPPLMMELENSTEQRMTEALNQAVCFSAILYTVVPVSAWITFGHDTADDFLINLGAQSLVRFLPERASHIASYAISISYSTILLCSFPIDNWSLRQSLNAAFFSSRQQSSSKQFYFVTYFILIGVYLSAISMKSATQIVSFVGCTSCSIIGLVLPGLILQRSNFNYKPIAWIMILCGLFLVFHGTVGETWQLIKKRPLYCN